MNYSKNVEISVLSHYQLVEEKIQYKVTIILTKDNISVKDYIYSKVFDKSLHDTDFIENIIGRIKNLNTTSFKTAQDSTELINGAKLVIEKQLAAYNIV